MTQQNYHGIHKIVLGALQTSNLPKDLAVEYSMDADKKVHAAIYPPLVPNRFVQMAVAMDTINLIHELIRNLSDRATIHAIGKKLQNI